MDPRQIPWRRAQVADGERNGDAALLRSAVVAEGRRNQGLGQFLVEQIILGVRVQGCRELFLLTETAQKYFEGFGFKVVTRDLVPEAVKQSVEFQGACPVGAFVMKRDIREDE